MKQQVMTANTANNIQQKAMDVLLDGTKLINKDYLIEMSNYQVHPLFSNNININGDVRIFKVERIVLENKQAVLESLTATYVALGTAGFSVFIWLDSDGNKTDLYLGVRGEKNRLQGGTAGKLLQESFKGHFSGSLLHQLDGTQSQDLLNKITKQEADNNEIQSVTAVSSIPSLSTEEREHFSQGLERFIDAAEGRTYQALILAEPLTTHQLSNIRTSYEQIATHISPLLKQQVSFGENQSQAVSLSLNETISTALGQSLTSTETSTYTDTKTKNKTYTTNQSVSGKSTEDKIMETIAGVAASGAIEFGPIGMIAGGAVMPTVNTPSDTYTKGSSDSTSYGTSHSISNANSYAQGQTATETQSYGKTESDTQTLGNSYQINLETTNKHIEQWLKRIDQHLQRLDDAQRYGGWQSAAYFMSKNTASTEALASIFLGLMRGKDSNGENFALTTWSNKEKKQLNNILNWLKNLSHPRLKPNIFQAIELNYLTPATLLSSKEVAIQLSLPRRSTTATPVIETQSFGRSIQNLDQNIHYNENKSIELGKIRHLWADTQQRVALNLNDLTSHVFVTGSTGSGKSNTVYQIIDELMQKDIPFLAIEPAKGEYKHIFGNKDNVRVFSTNITEAEVLKINPFKFPKGIHVFEHIDRLVEIFNVCWPMYAAMPAILKEAILLAYENAGWDLTTSNNRTSENLFPNFCDLLEALELVIEESSYSQEVKSNYSGSLITRIRSLTNGLNSQIFSSNEIGNEVLFDENVIIDLSRVGSQETKSLIMGILILRLTEYRMTSKRINSELRHITILEEAHNILKRTSTEQNSEGANVAGKAVEMLSNAIAEMRTYGEGFIITDQSPNAVDISAIRNTNTKIIMRLPDDTDRRLAGKAAALNDDQIAELAKLPKGNAVVYQNNWLEAVLCQVNHFKVDNALFNYQPPTSNNNIVDRTTFNLHLARLLLSKSMINMEKIDLSILEKNIDYFDISIKNKKEIIYAIHHIHKHRGKAPQDKSLLQGIFLEVTGLGNQTMQFIRNMNKDIDLEAFLIKLKRFVVEQIGDNTSEELLLFATDSCLEMYRKKDIYGQKFYHICREQYKQFNL